MKVKEWSIPDPVDDWERYSSQQEEDYAYIEYLVELGEDPENIKDFLKDQKEFIALELMHSIPYDVFKKEFYECYEVEYDAYIKNLADTINTGEYYETL